MAPRIASLLIALIAASAVGASTTPPVAIEPADEVIVETFLEHARTAAAKLTAEHFRDKQEPEMLCWVELKEMYMSLVAYKLTGDVTHMAELAEAIDNMRKAVTPGPDGYLGWRGKPVKTRLDPKRPGLEYDDIQTSFRAVWLFSLFVEAVDAEPRLKERFGHLRQPLIELMTDHLVKKWDARGYWVDLGAEGGTYRINNVPAAWDHRSLPWEKTSIAVDGLLALHRATGEDAYLKRAIKIGTIFKRRLKFTDGRYSWWNWAPLGRWDVHPDKPDKWTSWINASPIGGWYTVEAGIAAALYNHGVVFDRTDMERFTRTQVGVCWNGDPDKPVYRTVFDAPSNRKGQVFLCADLAPFSEKLADFIFRGRIRQHRIDKRESGWQGGVLTAPWLWSKYVAAPACAGGKPMYPAVGERFLAKAANREFVETHRFEVTEPGYEMPLIPSRAKSLPDAPDPADSAVRLVGDRAE